MKSIKKLFLGAAIFAAVLGFVGCKQPESGPSVVAEYTYSFYYLRFFDDQTVAYGAQVAGQSAEFTGTYTGDPTKDGTVKMKFDAASGLPSGELEGKINGKNLTFNYQTFTKK